MRTLHENALLRTNLDDTDVLRRRIRNGLRVTLDLSEMADRRLVTMP